MSKFRVNVSWSVSGCVEIEADDESQAEDKAHELSLSEFNAEYMGDSFEIDFVEELGLDNDGESSIMDENDAAARYANAVREIYGD